MFYKQNSPVYKPNYTGSDEVPVLKIKIDQEFKTRKAEKRRKSAENL